MSPLFNFYLFLGLVVIGVLLEVFLSQFHYFFTKKHYKKYHYAVGRYIFLLLFPFIALLYLSSQVGLKLITIFIAFAVLGTLLEWLVGFSFHMVVGHRLWSYYRYNINTYTSFLSIPLWGLAGVLFWLLALVFI